MPAHSRQVSSNQHHLHPRLAELVRKYLRTRYRRPVAPHNEQAFEQLRQALEQRPRPLVLDSFCGTGHSTALLARRHPGHLVVGIDKSAQRLARHPGQPDDDYLLLRADCEDIWQLLAQAQVAVAYHYLLYPNPWPKSGQVQRRVHAHPAFPLLPRLAGQAGGHIELRSNWQLYVEEFGVAMHLAGCPGNVSRCNGQPAMTLFEQKYQDSGHQLWAFTAKVPSRSRRDDNPVIGYSAGTLTR